MSGTQEPMAAQAVLFDEVYVPEFIAKCAAQGLSFPDQESIQTALESVAMLKAAEAAEKSSLTKDANEALRSSLKLPVPQDNAAASEQAEQEKQASVDLSKTDTIRQAIDTLASASSAR